MKRKDSCIPSVCNAIVIWGVVFVMFFAGCGDEKQKGVVDNNANARSPETNQNSADTSDAKEQFRSLTKDIKAASISKADAKKKLADLQPKLKALKESGDKEAEKLYKDLCALQDNIDKFY